MLTPAFDYQRSHLVTPDKIADGIDGVVDSMWGRTRRRQSILNNLVEDAQKVDAMASDWVNVSDEKLQERLLEYREIFRRRRHGWEESRLEALAAIREASARRLGLRPFVVQLVGALALHHGLLAEMATGEGKTLVAGLSAIMSGWTRFPCHVITVNDYLARRDAEWMRPLYTYCGVTVGHVTSKNEPHERVAAYNQDVTYTTSKEILADFLRDRIRMGTVQDATRRHVRYLLNRRHPAYSGLVMRGIHTAIVDEADSVLIDEAVTPLIISQLRENKALMDASSTANDIAAHLRKDEDYKVDARYKEIEFKDEAHDKIEALCHTLPGIWQGPDRRLELVRQALTAREFFLKGKQYVIQEDKVVIVDEFTGRIMPQRTWRQGLHQAIEAKESMDMTNPSETLARLSFQRFFRFFTRLSGMTGTAKEAGSEFWNIYRLPVVRIPLNRPSRRKQPADCIFPNQDAKWDAVVKEVQALHEEGLPVLIGTRSVTASEVLAERLREKNLEFSLLNAVHHEEEAEIISEAGHEGKITIATNMAGRGTDIILGPGIAERGGLQVLLTERHESGRIDRQFVGRCGRQGDPGCAQAFVSTDDELLKRFLPAPMRANLHMVIAGRLPGWRVAARLAFLNAQRSAQKLAFKQRKQVLKMDTWLEDALSFTGNAQVS